MTYVSEILDGGDSGPLFRVTSEGDEGESFEASSASGVWRKVLQRVNSLRVVQSLPPLESLPGPGFFGLSNPDVQRLVEGLAGAAECDGYVFLAYRRHRAHGVPQGDGQEGSESEFEFASTEEEAEAEDAMEDMMEDGRERDIESDNDNDIDNAIGNAINNDIDNDIDNDVDNDIENEIEDPEEQEDTVEGKEETTETTEKPKRQQQQQTLARKVPLLGNETKLRVRCRRVEGGFKAEDTFLCAWRFLLTVETRSRRRSRSRRGGRERVLVAPSAKKRLGDAATPPRVIGRRETTAFLCSDGNEVKDGKIAAAARRKCPCVAGGVWKCFRRRCCSRLTCRERCGRSGKSWGSTMDA